MIISLDYDETFTRDPTFWNEFVRSCRVRGHRVICVTMRYQYEGAPGIDVDEICFTGRRAKQPWCEENGVRVDVWIDDNPRWLVSDAPPLADLVEVGSDSAGVQRTNIDSIQQPRSASLSFFRRRFRRWFRVTLRWQVPKKHV